MGLIQVLSVLVSGVKSEYVHHTHTCQNSNWLNANDRGNGISVTTGKETINFPFFSQTLTATCEMHSAAKVQVSNRKIWQNAAFGLYCKM